MKPLKFLKGLLFLLIVVLSVVLNIMEEIIKFIFSLKNKIILNYQLMMFFKQLTR